MALAAGTKLGPYEILSLLGAGGMGEVYRARDTRLERTVAIKTLWHGSTSDPDLLRRFEREARLISALSHPHICTLFDIGREGEINYLVMEYLEGETLAKRLERGSLPMAEVLQRGIEIADAMEKAHRTGIVHRDLKPGNIILTKSGVKLLDFGLAKLVQSKPITLATAVTAMPTQDHAITGAGTIVGTLQYMAPEQLEGKDSDARTDIFAFGAVLYEMATGQRAFLAKSQASLIAAILSSEPTSIVELQPLTPPALDRVVRICLAKEPEDRWQNAHDLRLQLEGIRDAGSQAGLAPVIAKHRINRERIAWGAVACLLLVAALFATFRHTSIPLRQITFSVEPPSGYRVPPDAPLALSPDGSLLAYVAQDVKGKLSLWVRPSESISSTRVEGFESNTVYLSFSWVPDSRALIATLNGKLQRLSVSGGANEVLCDKFDGILNSVNQNGMVLAGFLPPANLVSISPENCVPHPVFQSVSQEYDMGYAFSRFLPDGKHFLFAGLRKDKHHNVLVSSLDGTTPRVVIRNGSSPKYIASGYILFSRDGYLMAQRFDAKSLRSSGDAFLVYRKPVEFAAAFGWADFDVSANGFISGKEQALPPRVLRWYSRSGEALQTVSEPGNRDNPRLVPQGTHAAIFVWDPRTHVSDMWSLDLEHGSWRRESFHEHPGGVSQAWSPDGKQIIYSQLVGSDVEMFVKRAGSSDNGQMLQTGLTGSKAIGDWSVDGKSIVYLFEGHSGNRSEEEVAIYGQLLGGGKPFRLGSAGADEEPPRLSPDGRWVAYQSNESGTSEIYVRPFRPDVAASVQVSSGGGHDPRWSGAAHELFYRTNDSRIMSVSWRAGKQIEFGKPVTLLRLPDNAEYDVVDGKRFLVNEPAGPTSGPLFVIANWKPEPQNPN
jgi:eukaryotic-like serine/threonine-protein kinase